MLKPGEKGTGAARRAGGTPALGVALGMGGLALAVFLVWRSDWRLAWVLAESAGKVRTESFVKWGLWWAAAVNAGLCAVLAATGRWWAGRGEHRTLNLEHRTSNIGRRTWKTLSRRDWVLLMVILMAAGALRLPRMGLSFYNDEAHAFRTYLAGRFLPTDEGGLKWRPAKWLDTLWLNKVGNNQMPGSVSGRICYDAWRKISGAQEGEVCEAAVRLPPFLAGMASLVVLWLAARRIIGTPGSWWVLALAALHPWHVRYSTEARAYALMLLGVALVFYFLQRAFEDGRWRWWLGLGLAQFWCVWSFTGSVYFLAVLNAMVLVRQAGLWMRREAGIEAVARPVAGWLIGAMLAMPLILPSVPQLLNAMQQQSSLRGVMGREWWSDAVAGVFFGMRGWDWDPENPHNPSLWTGLARQPWLWIASAGIVLSWVAGTCVLARRGGAGRVLALAGPVAVGLSWAVMSRQGKFLHPWYLLFAVPGLVLAMAAGLDLLRCLSKNRVATRILAVAAAGLVLTSWLPTDLIYLRHGKENLRGLAETARGSAYPELLRLEPAGLFAVMVSDVDVYDPRVVVLKTAADLDLVIAWARRGPVSLMVSVGHVGLGESPQVLERLRRSGEFEEVAVLRGLEEAQYTHYLFRLRTGR